MQELAMPPRILTARLYAGSIRFYRLHNHKNGAADEKKVQTGPMDRKKREALRRTGLNLYFTSRKMCSSVVEKSEQEPGTLFLNESAKEVAGGMKAQSAAEKRADGTKISFWIGAAGIASGALDLLFRSPFFEVFAVACTVSAFVAIMQDISQFRQSLAWTIHDIVERKKGK